MGKNVEWRREKGEEKWFALKICNPHLQHGGPREQGRAAAAA